MFYTYRQNNSGGSFIIDSDLSLYVIIEADNAYDANRIAEDKGIYFYGCDDGRDCPCCGDRWYPCDESDGEIEPLIYSEDYRKHESIWSDDPTRIYFKE